MAEYLQTLVEHKGWTLAIAYVLTSYVCCLRLYTFVMIFYLLHHSIAYRIQYLKLALTATRDFNSMPVTFGDAPK